jgi:undecaprenyl-diphosphatase
MLVLVLRGLRSFAPLGSRGRLPLRHLADGGRLHDYLLSVILGIIEGLTEFLPVSSTAHLRISEALFHISLTDGYWKMYSVVIQLGAILCLPVYFSERIAQFIGYTRGSTSLFVVPLKVLWCLVRSVFFSRPVQFTLAAFLVTAIPAFLLSKGIGKTLESLTVMGGSLLAGGVVMWVVDALHARAEATGPNASSLIHT